MCNAVTTKLMKTYYLWANQHNFFNTVVHCLMVDKEFMIYKFNL